jgi:hypothetical protein
MTDNTHDGIVIPLELMDASHHFDDCSRAARRGQRTDVGLTDDLPRTILLNHVVDSHKMRPHTNARIKTKIKPLKTTYQQLIMTYKQLIMWWSKISMRCGCHLCTHTGVQVVCVFFDLNINLFNSVP